MERDVETSSPLTTSFFNYPDIGDFAIKEKKRKKKRRRIMVKRNFVIYLSRFDEKFRDESSITKRVQREMTRHLVF